MIVDEERAVKHRGLESDTPCVMARDKKDRDSWGEWFLSVYLTPPACVPPSCKDTTQSCFHGGAEMLYIINNTTDGFKKTRQKENALAVCPRAYK